VAFVVIVVVALGLQLNTARLVSKAQRLYAAAGVVSRPWADRLSDARAAAALRPEVTAYRQRAASLQAARYVEIGALDKARTLLIEAWGWDRSAMYLREQLRDVNSLIWARDSRKAHILHGREKPGGVLEPDDLMP
jgi:hypothetical protein